MKTYRILALTWVALFGFFALFYCWNRFEDISIYHDKWQIPDMLNDVAALLFFIAGAVARACFQS
jgi:hypothetical protein